MHRLAQTAITMTEKSYDLEVSEDEWFRSVMAAGLPLLDHGLGVAGLVGIKPPTSGPIDIVETHVASGRPDFLEHHMVAMAELPPELLYRETQHARVATMSERPDLLEVWARHVPYARDALGITALDADGYGLQILAPLPEITKLDPRIRKCLQMIAAHLVTGHRLRRALQESPSAEPAAPQQKLPLGADAVIDPNTFRVSEAVGEAAKLNHSETIRKNAIAIDRARGRLRKEDPAEALHTWKALVRGRWSIVDWFDSDERRYVLAIPNPPRIANPRGLSEREAQVVAHARLGENHASIAYRLGVSRTTVTKALASAMRKLGVSTRAELLTKLQGLPTSAPQGNDESAQ